MHDKNIYIDKIEMLVFMILAFLIPTYVKFAPIAICILLILFLIRKRNYIQLKHEVKTLSFWLLIFPFSLYLIGLATSNNLQEALRNTETALSLLIFPFLAIQLKLNRQNNKFRLIKYAFILGVIVLMIFCLTHATINFIEKKDSIYFFYANLVSSPHHHSYYVLFAIIILVNDLQKLKLPVNTKRLLLEIALAIILSSFIVLLASKITLLLLLLYIIVIIVKMIIAKKINRTTSIIIFISIIASALTFYNIPAIKVRFDSMFSSMQNDKLGEQTKNFDSTTIRLKGIEAAFKIIKDNYLIGVGQGDVFPVMEKEMQALLPQSYNKTFAPHNQFLRSFVSFGILGIVSLLLLFASMLTFSIRAKQNLYLAWTLTMIAVFCVEDMLCIINGIIFFSFFTSIFLISEISSEKQKEN